MIVTCSGHIQYILYILQNEEGQHNLSALHCKGEADIRVSEFELKHKLVWCICRSV